MSNTICRVFTKQRGEYEQKYQFTTYSDIFSLDKFEGDMNFLMHYLRDVFIDGIKQQHPPKISSEVALDFNRKSVSQGPRLQVAVEEIKHPLVALAEEANYRGNGNQQHPIVQRHAFANDPDMLAYEIPVYDDEWEGHIDILRVVKQGINLDECGKAEGKSKIEHPFRFEIVDFKPEAHKETKAASQVWRYCNLFAQCTKIPLELIDGIYYDDRHAYQIGNLT